MSGFRLRWSELTKEGWHSRLPTGFPNNYTYLKPGKTKKDVRGVDYFVGEEELMKYLDRVDLAAKDSLSDVSSAAVIKVVPNPPNDVHRTLSCIIHSTAALILYLSFILYVSETGCTSTPEETQLPDSSNEESVSPTLRYESPHVTHRESQSPVDSSDVNVYQDMDNPDDFTAMVSDAENVDGASGDEECVEEETNSLDGSDDNEEDAIEDAVFNKDFLEAAGGIAGITGAPNKERLAHHWRTTDEGAIPRGRFGLYMTRDRFMHISRNLHFSNNADHRAVSDRAWKLRPVIDALQERFKSGYWPPPVMAFDEAMLPLRVYKKDKPHKWGTKLFMLCCSSSAYCIRFEVYCGKTQTCVNTAGTDAKSGPAAVVRNLKE
ncbi:hypothetical protein L916_04350, partial [Phytophthora nicotianae]